MELTLLLFSSVRGNICQCFFFYRFRLYFLLAWLNGVVQERLRYAPLGWSKSYEFTSADLRMACDVIDTWVERAAQGRTNITADKIPWEAISTLLAQCVYGGKVRSECG